jgi:predicted HTH transcriptional regulator
MYSELELLQLVERGEDEHTEFKRLVHSPRKIAKSMVAFANTTGGFILIGVDDDKRIVGIESEKEMMEVIENAATHHISAPISYHQYVVEYRGRDVLLVQVDESEQKPVYHISEELHPKTLKKVQSRKVYVRRESHNISASKDVIAYMKYEKQPIRFSYGENEQTLFRYLNSYHRITLKEFCKLVNISSARASAILITLVKAGVIQLHNEGRNNYYTLAALSSGH